MNPLGLHAMVVTVGGDAAAIGNAAALAAGAGYDLLEFPILDPASLDTRAARGAAEEHGLTLATSLGLDDGTDVSSSQVPIVEAGVRRLLDAVAVSAEAGAEWMCGVLASALGRYAAPPTAAGWANATAALREVADEAARRGVRLGLELVNRYESNLVNTVTDGLRFLDEVGSPNLYLHLDTYHALIEEESLPGAVRLAGDRLGYVHIGQNDRGGLSSGTADLDAFLAELLASGFAGPITFEAFSRAVSDPDLAYRIAIWRSPWTDGAALAAEAHDFLVERLSAAGSTS